MVLLPIPVIPVTIASFGVVAGVQLFILDIYITSFLLRQAPDDATLSCGDAGTVQTSSKIPHISRVVTIANTAAMSFLARWVYWCLQTPFTGKMGFFFSCYNIWFNIIGIDIGLLLLYASKNQPKSLLIPLAIIACRFMTRYVTMKLFHIDTVAKTPLEKVLMEGKMSVTEQESR